jgi:NodT family efflux transporter outer membrane factor (OMF) lipoprotein
MHALLKTSRFSRRLGSILLSWTLLAGGLCGCTTGFSQYVHNGFKVGPNYQKPPVPLTKKWVDEKDVRVHQGDPNLAAWWDVFDDPVLTALLQRSYSHNLSLKAAAFQVLQAREQRAIAFGEIMPQSQAFALSYIHGMSSSNGGSAVGSGSAFGSSLAPAATLVPVSPGSTPIAGVTPGGGSTTTTPTNPSVGSSIGSGSSGGGGSSRFFNNIATNANLSWELDFWGLFRRNLEAASASLDQSVENYDEMLVILLANVATQYVEIRTLQKRLDLARKNVALQEPLVAQYEQRYKAGAANSFPGYFQLKSNLDNTRALIPQLEISLRQANNLLCTLLGIPVRDLLPELGDGTVPDPADPKIREVRIPRPKDYSVVVGIEGDLLLRRPDVQAAERQLKIQSAQIGIAEAEMYPHMGINGSIGLAASDFGRLFNTNSWTGNIGPSLSWNILNYGRLLANVRLQNYQYQQYVATYQNTVLNANLDAENAMVAYLKSLDQTTNLKNSADAAAKLSGYLINQFKQGYLPPGAADTSAFINQVFTAVNFQVSQQDSAAQAEGNIALNLVLLYRAMGGGWQIRLPDAGKSCPNPGPDDFSLALPIPATVPVPQLPASEKLPAPQPVAPMPMPNTGNPGAMLGAPNSNRAAIATPFGNGL